MKHFALACLVLLSISSPAGLSAASESSHTFSGTYLWEQPGEMGTLEATFKPTGEGVWDVSFQFVFNGSPHTYVGTAQGSLVDGALEGQVLSDGRKRTFVFKGAFKAGTFTGTHAEKTRGSEERTGTLTLGSAPG
jgi:hypothetical protein